MFDNLQSGLEFSALIFFNLLCILSIIAIIVVIATLSSIKKKAEETMESIQDGIDNVNEAGSSVLDFLQGLREPKRVFFFKVLGDFFKRSNREDDKRSRRKRSRG